jgi:hypothetical protein
LDPIWVRFAKMTFFPIIFSPPHQASDPASRIVVPDSCHQWAFLKNTIFPMSKNNIHPLGAQTTTRRPTRPTQRRACRAVTFGEGGCSQDKSYS